jgi:hypothetical protein
MRDLIWMKARGIWLKGDQMVIPSRCQHLGAEQLPEPVVAGSITVGDGVWICKCKIQDKKPLVCATARCPKAMLGIE